MSIQAQDSANLLDKAEDYPRWVMYTQGLLRQQNCAWAIEPLIPIVIQDIRADLISGGLLPNQIRPGDLIKILMDKTTKQQEQLTRAGGIIQNKVAERHSHLIANKDAHEMWTILKTRFQDLSPMSATDILFRLSRQNMADFADASLYCAAYETALDKISGMVTATSDLTAKAAEVIIQGFMLANVGDSYAPLIAQLRREWKDKTDLTETSRAITTYAGNMKEKSKIMLASDQNKRKQPSQPYSQICTTPECAARERGNRHPPEKCWVLHPNLKPKRFKGQKTVANTESKGSEAAKPATHIDS